MKQSQLARKMRLKPGQRAAVVNAPKGYLKELSPFPPRVRIVDNLRGSFDWVQIFVKNKRELDKLAPVAIRSLKPESLLWVSFPKGSSNVQTDLTRDAGWDTIRNADVKWVTLISVNETWSAFALRHYRKGEKRPSVG